MNQRKVMHHYIVTCPYAYTVYGPSKHWINQSFLPGTCPFLLIGTAGKRLPANIEPRA